MVTMSRLRRLAIYELDWLTLGYDALNVPYVLCVQGKWAGWGLQYCTLWSTNVARDYLASTCPKIILQVMTHMFCALQLR
jgi:hypothetical protein